MSKRSKGVLALTFAAADHYRSRSRSSAPRMQAVITLSTLIVGCHSYPKRPMPDLPYERCSYRAERGGLKVGVEPFDTPFEVDVFGMGTYQNGYLPVYFRIEKTNSALSSEFHATEVTLTGKDGYKWPQVSADQMAHDYRWRRNEQGHLVASAISRVGAQIGEAERRHWNRQRVEDYRSKMFSEPCVIDPRSACRGFVLFHRDGVSGLYPRECLRTLEGARMVCVFSQPGGQPESFEFTLDMLYSDRLGPAVRVRKLCTTVLAEKISKAGFDLTANQVRDGLFEARATKRGSGDEVSATDEDEYFAVSELARKLGL